MKYLMVCKFCGRTLYKTDEALALVLKKEMQCPECEKILRLPADGEPKVLEEETKPGLEGA